MAVTRFHYARRHNHPLGWSVVDSKYQTDVAYGDKNICAAVADALNGGPKSIVLAAMLADLPAYADAYAASGVVWGVAAPTQAAWSAPLVTSASLGGGDWVRKVGGDYTFRGDVRSVFTKRRGATRYVVENDDGVLHIYSEKNLELDPAGPPPGMKKPLDSGW